MTMRQAPRAHFSVSPDLIRTRRNHHRWTLAVAGAWLTLALAAAIFAFGV